MQEHLRWCSRGVELEKQKAPRARIIVAEMNLNSIKIAG